MKGVYIVGYIETKNDTLLKSVNVIKNAALSVCKALKLNVVGENYRVFKGSNGITYCFILSQSHFVIHTWPEECKIFFDIFTCNKKIDKEKCVDILSNEFKGNVKDIKMVEYS